MDSDNITSIHQYQIPMSRAAADQDYVSDSVVMKMPHKHSALNLSVTTAGLDDQDIYIPLNISASVWSRIKTGKVSLDADKIPQFTELTGNDIYLRWIALKCGYECKPILSTIEQQLEQERAKTAALEHDNKLMRELLKK